MIKVSRAELSGIIDAIPSKSYAHRALILAALCNSSTTLFGKSTGVDTDATVGVLSALGANIQSTDFGYVVEPIKNLNNNISLNVKESGSTLRFILPLLSVLGISCHIDGEGRLKNRPNKELIETLSMAGTSFDNTTLPINMSGKFSAKSVAVRADISSQFVSGLLMAMQLLPYSSDIHLIGELKSKNYVDITISVMEAFGAKVTKTTYGYSLCGGGYTSPQKYTIEGDWSNSAFWLVAGAIGKGITVNNLNINSLQGDREIVDILKKANATITISENSVKVEKSYLIAFECDAENIPDLVPILSVLASFANGESLLTSVERLRFKESDRIQTTLDMLLSANVNAFYDELGIHIIGSTHKANTIQGANDHRIVMSGCIMATNTEGVTTITDENAVNKSYQAFYEDFCKLGGIINA